MLTISGTALGSGSDVTSVSLAGVQANIVSQTATAIVVQAAASLSAGVGSVVVVSQSAGTTTLANGFAYGALFSSLSRLSV